jgi:hypothetical protein
MKRKKGLKYLKDKFKRLAEKSFKRKLVSKYKKKKRNQALIGVDINTRREKNKRKLLKNQLSDYTHIKAPANFSMTQNTEKTLGFISNIEKCYKRKQKVFVDLTDVEKISAGAIVVLLSILVNFKRSNIEFNGNYPINAKAKNDLENSGFFKYLYKDIKDSDTYDFNNTICTHANKKVNSALSDLIIKKSSEYLWGEERSCPGLQRVFLELMQNTNNHASIENTGDKHWWATVYYAEDEKKVCFSFIDFGVGIFESLANKKEDNKFFDAFNKVKQFFSFTENSELLKLLLEGEVHKTVTGKYYRGKGLPGIYEACSKNKISNLIIVSNDAKADYNKKEFKKLNNKLSGTFVYWELNENNKNTEVEK